MTITAAISHAALPYPPTVCGIKLRPFSIGHWLHGQRFELSFLNGGDHTLGDLLLGVLICSRSYEQFSEGLRSHGIERAMALWQRKLSGGYLGRLKRTFRKAGVNEIIGMDFPKECLAFQQYVDESAGGLVMVNDWAVPITTAVNDRPSTPIMAPGPVVLLTAMTADLGLGYSESINMPLPWARWLVAVNAERHGRVSIVDRDAMLKDKEEADAFAAKVFAGEGADGISN